MGRGERDVNPVIMKFGLAVAVSLGGMICTFLRNKRIKPSQSPPGSSKSADCNNQVITVKESWGSKREHHGSHVTPNSCQFDPLGTEKHDELHNSVHGLSPNSRSNSDKDAYLLPEFNDLVKEFDTTAMKTNTEFPMSDAESPPKGYSCVVKDIHEQQIKSLRNTVKTLKERERNLEIQLLEYYGIKEQETAVMELQNRLKLNNMEAKLYTLKIEALQTDNKRLQAQMSDYAKVVEDLEDAKAEIKVLKKKLRSEAAENKERILDLQQRVRKMQDDEQKGGVGIDPEVQLNLRKLKDLEAEAEELRKSNHSLQLEKSELGQRLEKVQMVATSVLEDKETEKLKEERSRLKKQNEDLTKKIERLQADRCGDVEELVYLRWINACLRYELRNYQPGRGKTMARDLSKTLSPESEEKAKQLILEYANKKGVGEKGIDIQELDSEWSSSPASNLTDSGEFDESFINHSSPRKSSNMFFGKLVKLVRGKDSHSPNYCHHHRHDHHRQHSHSRNWSLDRTKSNGEDVNSYSDSSFGHSQRLIHIGGSMGIHRRIDSIAEGGDIGGSGGGLDSPSSSDGQKSDLVKYAEVLKDSHSKSTTKFRRRSTLFSSF